MRTTMPMTLMRMGTTGLTVTPRLLCAGTHSPARSLWVRSATRLHGKSLAVPGAMARGGYWAGLPWAAATAACGVGGAIGSMRFSTASASAALPAGVAELTLYQYEICPYCCKVKAYLDWAQLPYRVVEIHPIAKTEMKELGEQYGKENVGKVPVVMMRMEDGSERLLKESSDIIDELMTSTQTTPVGDPAEQKQWRTWVDEKWVRVVTVNIYRTVGESLQTFEYMPSLGKFSAFETTYVKYGGGLLMYMVAKKMRGKYKIADQKDADPRDDLYACAKEWTAAMGERPYMGGDSPSLADLGVYGVLQAIRGMDTFTDLLEHNVEMAGWYKRMGAHVQAARLPTDGVAYVDPRA